MRILPENCKGEYKGSLGWGDMTTNVITVFPKGYQWAQCPVGVSIVDPCIARHSLQLNFQPKSTK